MSEMRRVTAIRNGTVVDHIPSGNAMQVIRILRIDTDRACLLYTSDAADE